MFCLFLQMIKLMAAKCQQRDRECGNRRTSVRLIHFCMITLQLAFSKWTTQTLLCLGCLSFNISFIIKMLNVEFLPRLDTQRVRRKHLVSNGWWKLFSQSTRLLYQWRNKSLLTLWMGSIKVFFLMFLLRGIPRNVLSVTWFFLKATSSWPQESLIGTST